MITDTIVAVSTPFGEGAIAIIRLSGSDAVKITDTIFKGKYKLTEVSTHTIHYGKIIDPKENNFVDEVMVTIMKSPKTYTKEDVVEINCHGGIVTVQKILQILIEAGARLAEPGEFTKRAFLNGRIDLSQAEAVIDLIRAKTDKASSLALKQLEGRLSIKIKELRNDLLALLANLEVTIDYPEHDIPELTYTTIKETTDKLLHTINKLLQQAKEGKIFREGVATAIIGRPNVGKSSLLNYLLNENRAIVTEIPGTTRDIIEEYINIKGIPLKLIDTAGIRETEDIVEKIGVEKTKKVLQEADLLLYMLNNNEELTHDEIEFLNLLHDKQVIVIINKIDLPTKIAKEFLVKLLPDKQIISISLRDESGIDDLLTAIENMFTSGNILASDFALVTNSRHISLLNNTVNSLKDILSGIDLKLPVDILAIDLHYAYQYLGEIIGEEVKDDLIDQIFSQFCVGK